MKILLVEDKHEHLKQAIAVLRENNIEFVAAMTARDATDKLYRDGTSIDGVITDIYMPLNDQRYWDHGECPCGLVVAAEAVKRNIPFVFCTSGYHHGSKFQWISDFCGTLGGPWRVPMVDSGSDMYEEAKTKPWKQALERLLAIINEPKRQE